MVINSIEGANALGSGIPPLKARENLNLLKERIAQIKSWKHPPFFITFAHHFYNEFCGHAQSLGPSKIFLDQKKGLNTGITQVGWRILESLLGTDNGKRILIDLKHMSYKSRKQFYEFRNTHLRDLPLIVSHAGVTGMYSKGNKSSVHYDQAKFNSRHINFFDYELLEIEKSGGLFGIQLDERRIASKAELKDLKKLSGNELNKKAVELLWNQIQHIAEVLDRNGRFAWGIQSLGSDFDGVVDPINGFYTSAHFKNLRNYLLEYADNFLKEHAVERLTQDSNRRTSKAEIVDRFLSKNVLGFLKKHFK